MSAKNEYEPIPEKFPKKQNQNTINNVSGETKTGFNLLFFKRFFLLLKKIGFFSIPQIFLFCMIIILSILMAYSRNNEFELMSNMYVVVSDKRTSDGWGILLNVFLWHCVEIVLFTFLSLIGISYQYLWRKILTTNVLNEYFEEKNYYVILNMKHKIDNPPQRIHSDANDFCVNLMTVFTGTFPQITQIAFNTYFIIFESSWMLIPIYIWPLLNFVCYGILFTPISKGIWKKDKFEGEFRFSHARIREHCESISFFKSDKMEEKNVRNIFSRVLKSWMNLVLKFLPFNLWNSVAQNIPSLCYLLCLLLMIHFNAYPFYPSMGGKEAIHAIAKLYQLANSTGIAIATLFAFSKQISIVLGSTARVGGLFEAFKEVRNEKKKGVYIEDENQIQFHNVEILTPNKKVLLSKFELKIERGDHIIIMGESGCGKSSILRVLGGLWNLNHGLITKPFKIGLNGIYFLPQRPYLIKGSLKTNVIYPKRENEVNCTDRELIKCLDLAMIGYISNRASLHEGCLNWDEKLSLGEQQRIGIARLLFHKPYFAIMDESTSALDSYTQEKVFENLIKSGITLISVAHRKTVMKYHKKVIEMNNNLEIGCSIKFIENEMIPKYKKIWNCEKEYKKTEMEKIDFEISKGEKDIEKDDKNIGKTGFNWTFLKRLYKLIFKGIMIKNKCEVIFLICAIIVTIIQVLLIIPIVSLSTSVLGALSERKVMDGIIYLLIYLVCFIFLVIGYATYLAMWQLLGIRFRRNITDYIHSLYFHSQSFYEMNILDKEVDNADQRICADANLLTSGFDFSPGLPFFSASLISCIVSFLSMTVAGLFSLGPLAIVFSFVTTVVAGAFQIILMLLIAKYSFIQSKREGYFRISLERLKEYSEQICFYDGIEREKEIIMERFNAVMKNQLILSLIVGANSIFLKIIDEMIECVAVLIYLTSVTFGIISIEGKTKDDIIQSVQSGVATLTGSIKSGEGILMKQERLKILCCIVLLHEWQEGVVDILYLDIKTI